MLNILKKLKLLPDFTASSINQRRLDRIRERINESGFNVHSTIPTFPLSLAPQTGTHGTGGLVYMDRSDKQDPTLTVRIDMAVTRDFDDSRTMIQECVGQDGYYRELTGAAKEVAGELTQTLGLKEGTIEVATPWHATLLIKGEDNVNAFTDALGERGYKILANDMQQSFERLLDESLQRINQMPLPAPNPGGTSPG